MASSWSFGSCSQDLTQILSLIGGLCCDGDFWLGRWFSRLGILSFASSCQNLCNRVVECQWNGSSGLCGLEQLRVGGS